MATLVKGKFTYRRPDKVKAYKKQVEFIDAPARFTVVEATTKAGKTSGCIVWLFEQAISPYGNFWVNESGELVSTSGKILDKDGFNYWWVAPTYKIAKIAYRRFKRYIKPKEIFTANETEHTIQLANGAMIFFKSGDDPDGLYGDDVYACVIDEATRMKEDSWTAIFSTLTATEGSCKIIGNVKGANNWVYKLAREAETGKENWKYFKITADDAVNAGILKRSVIDEAERTLPKGIFLELYYGIPFVNSANKFAYAFDKGKHVKAAKINHNYPIYLSFDFNKNPICCGIYQHYGNRNYCPRIVKLDNSNIYKLCEYLKNLLTIPGQKYNPDNIIVNGDASGKAGSALVKDNLNYFRIIKAELDLSISQMQQLAVNPKIEDNQVLVNAVLEHVEHDIDPDGGQPLIFDLEFAEMLPDGTLKKADRNDPKQQLDALDTYRYWINRNFRHYLKGVK